MSTEIKKEIQLEIAHVLFIDIVGYSKLAVNEQSALVERLNDIVLLSAPGAGALASSLPLTPAVLRLDPMFDPLRNDPRFQKLIGSSAPRATDK